MESVRTGVPFSEEYQRLAIELQHEAKNVQDKVGHLTETEQKVFADIRKGLDALAAQVPPGSHDIKAVQKLSIELERMAAHVQKVTGSFLGIQYVPDLSKVKEELFEDVTVPLCSGPMKPSDLAADLPPVRAGLTQLDAVADMVRIKGDGDCLFRAIGTGVSMRFLGHASQLTQCIQAYRDSMSPTEAVGVGKFMKAFEACHNLEDVVRLMQEPQFSNAWTSFLRHLAVLRMQEKAAAAPDEFEAVLTAESPSYTGRIPDYFRDMVMARPPMWGGQLESVALSEVFHVPVQVMDVAQIGRTQRRVDPLSTDAVYLAYHPGHYNLVMPKRRVA